MESLVPLVLELVPLVLELAHRVAEDGWAYNATVAVVRTADAVDTDDIDTEDSMDVLLRELVQGQVAVDARIREHRTVADPSVVHLVPYDGVVAVADVVVEWVLHSGHAEVSYAVAREDVPQALQVVLLHGALLHSVVVYYQPAEWM